MKDHKHKTTLEWVKCAQVSWQEIADRIDRAEGRKCKAVKP